MTPILPARTADGTAAVTDVTAPRERRLGLRSRTSLAFALGALVLAISLASLTYVLTQSYLLRQRESFARRQTYVDARLARDSLLGEAPDIGALVDALAGTSQSDLLVHFRDRWYTSAVDVGETALPPSLRQQVAAGNSATQRFDFAGRPLFAVGVPLSATGAEYYEIHSLSELEKTLSALRTSLVAAASTTMIAAALGGLFVSRRVLRPLREVSAASVDIAHGQLATRLRSADDPDLASLVHSFNEMAQALEDRIEREMRFASNVSHELRTPLTALSNAAQVLRGRIAELPPRTRTAIEIVESQIGYFEQLVLDLLEISRFDAGAERSEPEPTDLLDFVTSLVRRAGSTAVVDPAPDTPDLVLIDSRRVDRVLVNLLDNASHYAGGATRVGISYDGRLLRFEVDDAGPGIPEAQREKIFERFARGESGGRTTKGTGLGLALVRAHTTLLGGTASVTSSPSGGARFVIEIPAEVIA